MPKAKKTLLIKLLDVCRAVTGIPKRGRNTRQNYDYLKAEDVAEEFRNKLFSAGILLTSDELEVLETTYKDTSAHRVFLKVEFTFHDTASAETLVRKAYGVGIDYEDKALYKAKTGAMKYLLKGLSLLPDAKDDPEFAAPPETGKRERGPIAVPDEYNPNVQLLDRKPNGSSAQAHLELGPPEADRKAFAV